MTSPRRIETFLLDGTLEGVRIVDIESTIQAFVIPRLALGRVKDRVEIRRPGLYFLISSDSNRAYIGETDGSYDRLVSHTKNKAWWDVAVLIVHITDDGLDKSDVKFMESLAIKQARDGSIKVENKTSPAPNTVRETRKHTLQNYIQDIQFILTFLGYDILTSAAKVQPDTFWYCTAKKTRAKAMFKGDQFVILAGSHIDTAHTDTWARSHSSALKQREEIFASRATIANGVATLTDNIAFRSPNTAGGFAVGHNVNAWVAWKNEIGQTMDEVMRKGE